MYPRTASAARRVHGGSGASALQRAACLLVLALGACGDDAGPDAPSGGNASVTDTAGAPATMAPRPAPATNPPGEPMPAGPIGSAGAMEVPDAIEPAGGMAAPPTSGTGGAPGTGGSGGSGQDGEDPPLAFACPGGSIGPGMNELVVAGRTRTLHAEFPADTAVPIGVVFSWHGYNEDPVAYRNNLGLDPDADPALPLAVITPDDVDFEVPIGLDWQLDSGDPAQNADLAFFEAMVGCLDAQYDIDSARIYSVGFSAGSVISSLLHSRYPKLLSAIVCFSGMWFNDPAQVAMINLVQVSPTWPALDPADGGAVLLTHGGPGDVTVLNVANLENMAQAAFPFLAAANRVVVDCAHDRGHIPHPEIPAATVARFFASHRTGEPSPYRSGGYSGFPASCALRLP